MSTKGILLHGIFSDQRLGELKGKSVDEIFVLEGRPSLDAAKHTCSILHKMDCVPTVMADNMAGYLFSKDLLKEVWISFRSADKNGVVADIGALILAVMAQKHGIPVFAFALKRSTALLGKAKDLQSFNGELVIAGRIKAFVPLVEWVPAKYLKDIYE